MLKVLVLLTFSLQVFGASVLIWSESGVGSLESLKLGAQLNEGQFQSEVLAPVCSDHKVVLLETPNVTLEKLYQIGGDDNELWKSMKSLLSKAEVEKLVQLNSNAGGLYSQYQSTCDFERVQIHYNAEEEDAAVVVDEKISQEVEKQISADTSKPIVYILRLLPEEGVEQEENLVRRSPGANTPGPPTASEFVYTKCHRFYSNRIVFQPLRPPLKDVERFSVKDWQDDGSECDAATMKTTKKMTIKMKGTKPENSNFTDIKLEFVVKANGLYGSSGKSFKYWYAESMSLSYQYKDTVKTARISPGYIAAPQGNSYACQKPDNQPLAGAAANLLFSNLQFDVNMYIDGTQPTKSDTFNDGVDCEARLGKGGIVGLFFVIIVLLTTLYIIAMLSSAKNPVFGDKQIVVNQE